MRFIPTIIVSCLASGTLLAQNLVPNPSFELVTNCPGFASELDKAAPWFNPTQGTPELYHACAPLSSYVSVPNNTTGGYQFARTGQGYAGLFTWRTDVANMREYAEVPLTSSLQAGMCYRVRFYVNMPNDHPFACDGIGAYFSVGPVGANSGLVLPYTAHVQHPAGVLITDTLGWTEVSGVYVASGGETHLTIGNFEDDGSTQTAQIASGLWYTTSAYLLLDDVSVEALELTVDLGPDTLLCTGSSLVLDASYPGATYLWNDGSTSATRQITQASTYWVTVSVGACSVSDTIQIDAGQLPEFDLPRSLVLCPGGALQLDASVPGASIRWMDGDTNAVRTIAGTGTYTVTATNTCGSTSAAVDIRQDLCPCVPYLPSAFTPNADGINDRVGPEFRCGTGDVSWEVYDRWGSLVYDAADLSTWDGTIAGHPVPAGVYVWIAQVHGGPEAGVVYMGHVTLIR